MYDKQTPLEIEGITESLYAGFWARLGSLLLDIIFVLPILFLALYLNGFGKYVYFMTFIPSLVFGLWYNIYLPKKHGGTPGKLAVGIQIIRLDGEAIGWKEAFLRHSVVLAFTLLSGIIMTVCLLQADDTTFANLGWLKRSAYIMSFSPAFFMFYTWATNIWFYGELIVLLTNKRKRAVHDFIAGTVIVRTKYLGQIRAAMNPSETNLDNAMANENNLNLSAQLRTEK
jgi:uncharacterized RDD family membrane protein YckC